MSQKIRKLSIDTFGRWRILESRKRRFDGQYCWYVLGEFALPEEALDCIRALDSYTLPGEILLQRVQRSYTAR